MFQCSHGTIHPRKNKRNKSTKAPQAAADGVFESLPPAVLFSLLFQKGKVEKNKKKNKINTRKNLYDRPMVVRICEANIHQPHNGGKEEEAKKWRGKKKKDNIYPE